VSLYALHYNGIGGPRYRSGLTLQQALSWPNGEGIGDGDWCTVIRREDDPTRRQINLHHVRVGHCFENERHRPTCAELVREVTAADLGE